MYRIDKIYKKTLGGTNVWLEETDLETTVSFLSNNNKEVVFNLVNLFTNKEYHLYLKDQTQLQSYNRSIIDFLISNGSNTLNTKDGFFTYEKVTAFFIDGWNLNLKAYPAKAGFPDNADVADVEKKDLRLKANIEDHRPIGLSALYTINGYLHFPSSAITHVDLIDGNINYRENTFGVIDFTKIGKVTCIPFNSNMVVRPFENNRMFEKTFINTKLDLSDKTVFVSILGRLHALDNTYFRVNDTSICLQINKMDIAKKIFDSNIPLSYFGFDDDQKEFTYNGLHRSENLIRRVLRHTTTFLIVIDNPDVFVNRLRLESTGTNGMYFFNEKTNYPAFSNRGLMKEYVIKHDWGTYVYFLGDTRVANYASDLEDEGISRMTTSYKQSRKPYSISNAYLLEIGAYV